MATEIESNAQIVASYRDAVLRKDHSAVDRFFDPKVEYFVNGTSQRDPELKLPRSRPSSKRRSRGWAIIAARQESRRFWKLCTPILRSPLTVRGR